MTLHCKVSTALLISPCINVDYKQTSRISPISTFGQFQKLRKLHWVLGRKAKLRSRNKHVLDFISQYSIGYFTQTMTSFIRSLLQAWIEVLFMKQRHSTARNPVLRTGLIIVNWSCSDIKQKGSLMGKSLMITIRIEINNLGHFILMSGNGVVFNFLQFSVCPTHPIQA